MIYEIFPQNDSTYELIIQNYTLNKAPKIILFNVLYWMVIIQQLLCFVI